MIRLNNSFKKNEDHKFLFIYENDYYIKVTM